jgi:hypothetical protein
MPLFELLARMIAKLPRTDSEIDNFLPLQQVAEPSCWNELNRRHRVRWRIDNFNRRVLSSFSTASEID